MTTAITSERSEREIAIEINLIKNRAARDLLSAAVEVGRLLCEAKEKVPYGEWGDWLRDNVAYSVSNANNMMRLYQEQAELAQIDMFHNNDFAMFEGMTPSQVLALLPVPREERAKFIQDNDAHNMSVREINDAVKARKEAEKRAEEAEKRASEAQTLADAAKRREEDVQARLESAETQIKLMESMSATVPEEERKRIEKEAAAKAKEAADKKIAAAEKKAAADLKKAQEEGESAVRKVEQERDAAIKVAVDEARAVAERESAEKLRALEDKLKAKAVEQSPHLTRFKTLMETFQETYKRMLGVISEAETAEPETAVKLRAVLDKITDTLKGA